MGDRNISLLSEPVNSGNCGSYKHFAANAAETLSSEETKTILRVMTKT
jgi:hypothetical protein